MTGYNYTIEDVASHFIQLGFTEVVKNKKYQLRLQEVLLEETDEDIIANFSVNLHGNALLGNTVTWKKHPEVEEKVPSILRMQRKEN